MPQKAASKKKKSKKGSSETGVPIEGVESGGEDWLTSRMLFGLSIQDAESGTSSDIPLSDFERFLDLEVTPRFPSGLTWTTTKGQFLGDRNGLIKETSAFVYLLSPLSDGQHFQKMIDIAGAFVTQFSQESVLVITDVDTVYFVGSNATAPSQCSGSLLRPCLSTEASRF